VRWLSGRKQRFAKAPYPKRVPRVRIPPSPPCSQSREPIVFATSSASAYRRFERRSTGGARYAQGLPSGHCRIQIQSQCTALDNSFLTAGFAAGELFFLLARPGSISPRRIAIPVQDIPLGILEILLRFILLSLLLPLLLRGRAPFGFLVSPARRVGAFATGEENRTRHQANDLKVFHIWKYITSGARMSVLQNRCCQGRAAHRSLPRSHEITQTTLDNDDVRSDRTRLFLSLAPARERFRSWTFLLRSPLRPTPKRSRAGAATSERLPRRRLGEGELSG
jgi:hypothetical protein